MTASAATSVARQACRRPGSQTVTAVDPADVTGTLAVLVQAPQTGPNGAPVVTAGPEAFLGIGTPFVGSGSFQDADSTSWTVSVDYGDGTVAAELRGNRFVAADSGYPIKMDTIRDIVASSAELAFEEARTADPNRYGDLGLADPGDKNASEAGKEVTFRTAGGEFGDFVVGSGGQFRGTIKSLEVFSDDQPVWDISELSLDAVRFAERLEAGKSKQVVKEIFAKADTIDGSHFDDNLYGGKGPDEIKGWKGDDIIAGAIGVALAIAFVILPIIAAVKANGGEQYRYPITAHIFS